MTKSASRLRQRVALVVAATLGVIVGGGSVALSAGALASSATLSSSSASTLTLVRVVRDANPAETTSTTFVDVPGAATTISVPSNTKALIVARFSASSTCFGPVADASCFVRILIGNAEGKPSGVNLSTFDKETVLSPTAVSSPQQAHMIERSRGGLTPGSYQVKVQMAVPNSGATLALVNWNLTVERVRV
jgi:hypothetical protein